MPQSALYYSHPRARVSQRLHVDALGVHEMMPPGLIRHGGSSSRYPFLLMLFHTLAVVLQPDGTLIGAKGKLILWDQSAEHHYGRASAAWDHSWLRLTGKWASRAFHSGELPLNVPFPIGDEQLVLRYLRLACEELNRYPLQDADMLEGIFSLLWHELTRSVLAGTTHRPHDPRLENARRFIESSFTQPFGLAKAAEQAALSPSHFCAQFSKQFGVPPGEYATRLRLHRAAHLLLNPDLAVFQVAQMVGYEDPLYFSRLFRKRHGASPNEYRRKFRNSGSV